jgi:nucleoside-diphosphate-sugar epimerase
MLRPKTFLGPGRMGLFAMLFEWAEEGRNFPVLGRGDARIQMLAIEDLVEGVLRALTAPADVANDTYNLAAARFGTLREDFQAVLDAAGHGKRVVSLPARPALAALRGLERARLSPVYGRLVHKLLADSYVSIDKARARLGFTPAMSNRDAILATYRWWQTHHRTSHTPTNGRTSRDPWRQGALGAVKVFF